MTVMLREKLFTIFETLKEKDPSLTPYKIALETALDPAHLRTALKGDRPFSDSMLEKLASHPALGVSLDQLFAWRMMDEYTREQIEYAIRELRPPPES